VARRRTKRTYQLTKRCSCRTPDTCLHPWWLRVLAHGKRQRINLTERYALPLPMTRTDVEVHAAKAKDDARKGRLVPKIETRLTFGDVADLYVAAFPDRSHHYVKGLREIAVQASAGAVVKLESKPVEEVTTADIEHAVKVWQQRKRMKAGTQKGLVGTRHLLQTARHLFNWAIKRGHITKTPFRREGVTLITVRPGKGRSRRLEEGEEARILDAADDYIKDFFVAMIETGCRPGELRTLQWREVRDDYFVVLPEKAKDRDERRIPIMPTLREILDRRRIGPDGDDLSADSYVFGNDVGDEMQRRYLCRRWLDTCERAKVENLHLHDLRGEAASQLLEAGAPLHEVRDALGHSSTTMTSTYLRTRTNSLQDTYRRRDALRLAHAGQSKARTA
jgi:integrase